MPSGEIRAFALFAHCFTCGKDVVAASRIARSLVSSGFAVMRFDFTGLGNSDGDFSNTNFSSNVGDLVKAADFLRSEYDAPALLIGHSLGGTAILHAAHKIPEAQGVVTIGSPADASHVCKQFSVDLDNIQSQGSAVVKLAGRSFTIKKQFLDDIQKASGTSTSSLRKSLLIFHSPRDNVVSINQAEKIYQQAKHPKSFISLGNADHLLTAKEDSEYVAQTIATWSNRIIKEKGMSNPGESQKVRSSEFTQVAKGEVVVEERDHLFSQNIVSDQHTWIADEPVEVGGSNLGPDPYEQLLAALGSCTSMTIRMYANRKKWPVEHIRVRLSHLREHGKDCQRCDSENRQVDVIAREISLTGSLSEEQISRLLEIADRCPVHKTLHGKLVVETKISM